MQYKRLRIFDFDDTLVKTDSYVYVNNGDSQIKLTPGQYAVYKEKPGDEYDYSDFKSVKNPSQIKQMTKVFKRIANKRGGKGLYILTARSAYKPIRRYLKDIGVDMKYIFVKALGSNDPNDKSKWIENQIDKFGYNNIYFADDSQKNIDAVRNMLERKKVKFVVQKINY